MKIKEFYKISGSGNDFIMIDGRGGFKKPPRKYIEKLCARGTGVGADGLILLKDSKRGLDFKMVYYNSDGREADMCGNGGRSIVLFAHLLKVAKRSRVVFESRRAVHEAEIKGKDTVKLEMQTPHSLRHKIILSTSCGKFEGSFINTGVPHFVISAENIENIDVFSIGREIRNSKMFGREGANVDFIQYKNGKIHIRTYERGVENETLACGTGAVASAVIYRMEHRKGSPVSLITRSKELLKVYFSKETDKVYLEGRVTLVYKGILYL